MHCAAASQLAVSCERANDWCLRTCGWRYIFARASCPEGVRCESCYVAVLFHERAIYWLAFYNSQPCMLYVRLEHGCLLVSESASSWSQLFWVHNVWVAHASRSVSSAHASSSLTICLFACSATSNNSNKFIVTHVFIYNTIMCCLSCHVCSCIRYWVCNRASER